MPLLSFTAGTQLPAATMNSLARQAVITCTSGSRPTPVQGMTIYETDTNKLLTYTTATTGWQKPWSDPWGILDYTENGSDVTSSANPATAITGSSVTLVANRRIRVSTTLHMSGSGSGSSLVCTVFIANAANTTIQTGYQALVNNSNVASMHLQHTFTSSAGSFQAKARIGRGGESWTLTSTGGFVASITVEDCGPAAAPA